MSTTDAERNDAYRAVGRYVVEFSRMIFHMRFNLERQADSKGDTLVAPLLLGRASAQEVRRAFFGVCRSEANLDDSESKIADRLESGVERELKWRNKFAHGDWWVGFGRKEDGSGGDPMLGRPGAPNRGSEMQELPADKIDEISDRLYALRQQLGEFGDICLGTWPFQHKLDWTVRVADVFTINGATIVRDGPVAQAIGIGTIQYS